jgi:hypothetical protein
MALNFGILQPANISGQLQAGQESAMRNQLAQQQLAAGQQQMETGRMQQEKAGLEMQQFKRRQSALDQFLAHAEKGGQTGDPEEVAQNFYKFAVANGEPQILMAAQQALMAAKERKQYLSERMPGGAPAPGAPALNVVSRNEGVPRPVSAQGLAPVLDNQGNMLRPPTPEQVLEEERRWAQMAMGGSTKGLAPMLDSKGNLLNPMTPERRALDEQRLQQMADGTAGMAMPAVTGRPIQPDQALNVVSRSEGSPSPIPTANMLAPAAAAPVNALAAPAPAVANPAAALQAKIIDLQMRYPSGVAKPEIDMLTKQLEAMQKMHVVGRNLVTSTGQKVFESAQDITPSDIKRLTLERDALAPNDPNRKLYDQAIADIGSANRIAQQRLAFDQGKFAWEKANPGFELKEAEDGSIVGVNKRTLQAFPVTVGGAAPAAAPAMPGGGVPGARLPAPGAGPAAPGMAPPAAGAPGVPLMGKGTAMTETQSNAAMFGGAMAQAQNTIKQLEKSGTVKNAVVPGLLTGLAQMVPFGVGDGIGNVIQSTFNADPTGLIGPNADQQKLAQSQLAFATAYLRKTSGAAFGASEISNTIKEFFPLIGEGEKVIAQKAAARERAVEGMKISTNREGKKYIEGYGGGGAPAAAGRGGGIPNATPTNPLGLPGL